MTSADGHRLVTTRFASVVARLVGRPRPGRPVRRVVHVSPAYFDPASHIGGGERYPTSLARAMAELVETRLVTFGPRRASLRRDGLRIEVYPTRELIDANPVDPHALGFLPEVRRADVIHCHQDAPFVSTVAVLAAAALGRPCFVTDHGGGGWNFGQRVPTHRFVARFCPVSEFAVREVERHKVTVIRGGVDPTFLIDPPAPWPRAPGVLFVGRVLPHKGVNDLIEAVPADLPLTVMGPAYDLDYLGLLKRMADGKRVKFVTDADDAAVRAAYRAATVTVLPSVYTDCYGRRHERPELLGLTLIESQACGTPAICTAVGGMPEFVDDGETGFVVPPNSPDRLRHAITRLTGDPALAARFGAAGRKAVEGRFTWDRVARLCLDTYTAAAHGRGFEPRAAPC